MKPIPLPELILGPDPGLVELLALAVMAACLVVAVVVMVWGVIALVLTAPEQRPRYRRTEAM